MGQDIYVSRFHDTVPPLPSSVEMFFHKWNDPFDPCAIICLPSGLKSPP